MGCTNSKNAAKTLVIIAGDAGDADHAIELAIVSKSGADILFFLNISKPYGVSNDVLKYEDIVQRIKQNPKQSNFDEVRNEFNETIRSKRLASDTSYEFGTIHKPEILGRRVHSSLQTLFSHNKKKDDPAKLFVRYKTENNEYFVNRNNAFGLIWNPESAFFDEKFEESADEDNFPVLDEYSEVILIISGSTAFWGIDKRGKDLILAAKDRSILTYVIVMGGVETKENPTTLRLEGLMIRHPLATMNQIYDPESFTDIAKQLSTCKWVVVTNNVVNRIAKFTDLKDQEEFLQFILEKILQSSKEENPLLYGIMQKYYIEADRFKWKLFDCLTGKLAHDHLTGIKKFTDFKADETVFNTLEGVMFTESKFGITLLGSQESVRKFLEENRTAQNIPEGIYLENVLIPAFSKEWYLNAGMDLRPTSIRSERGEAAFELEGLKKNSIHRLDESSKHEAAELEAAALEESKDLVISLPERELSTKGETVIEKGAPESLIDAPQATKDEDAIVDGATEPEEPLNQEAVEPNGAAQEAQTSTPNKL